MPHADLCSCLQVGEGFPTPVLVIIWYDPADVPPDVREEDIKLYAFDEDSGE